MKDITTPRVLISGFADEVPEDKNFREQLAVCSALGLHYFSLRFVNLGDRIQNAMSLSNEQVGECVQLIRDYGMRVCSLGSPIGKVKLRDEEDGTQNRFVPFAEYLDKEVRRACELCHLFGTRLLRAFSFYPPRGQPAEPFLAEAVDYLGQIADRCASEGLILGIEMEANLVGRSGATLAEIHRQLSHPAAALIFDGANLSAQGYDRNQVLAAYHAVKPGLGWIHVKDYRRNPLADVDAPVDEGALSAFVPVGLGDSAYPEIFADLRENWNEIAGRIGALGIEGLFMDLEPHVRGGGQFGGFSGADGFGIALRSLLQLLDHSKLVYELKDAGVLGL
jgi:sugar phosphate isomerase/epimerase